MRCTSMHLHRQDTNAESCSVKRMRGETPSIQRRATLSLTKRERTIKTIGSQRCIRQKGRNCSREDHVADRYILLCNKQSHENSNRKTAPDKVCDKLHTSPCLDCFFIDRCNSSCMHMSTTSKLLDEKLIGTQIRGANCRKFRHPVWTIMILRMVTSKYGDLADACAKQQWDIEKTQLRGARQKMTISDFLPDECEYNDARIQKARNPLERPVEPAMPCGARLRIPTVKTQTQAALATWLERVKNHAAHETCLAHPRRRIVSLGARSSASNRMILSCTADRVFQRDPPTPQSTDATETHATHGKASLSTSLPWTRLTGVRFSLVLLSLTLFPIWFRLSQVVEPTRRGSALQAHPAF